MNMRRFSFTWLCPMYSARRVGRKDNSNSRSSAGSAVRILTTSTLWLLASVDFPLLAVLLGADLLASRFRGLPDTLVARFTGFTMNEGPSYRFVRGVGGHAR